MQMVITFAFILYVSAHNRSSPFLADFDIVDSNTSIKYTCTFVCKAIYS